MMWIDLMKKAKGLTCEEADLFKNIAQCPNTKTKCGDQHQPVTTQHNDETHQCTIHELFVDKLDVVLSFAGNTKINQIEACLKLLAKEEVGKLDWV